jgi:enoyl-CoA hydratase/carnithine racemase
MRDAGLQEPMAHKRLSSFPEDMTGQRDATTLQLVKESDAMWRVTFRNPPINMIDYAMLLDLRRLFDDIESGNGPSVLVFESADPDFFLAHYDVSGDNLKRMATLTAGPTGLDPWLDLLVRLSKLPAVTISAIRGRARMAGSEFVLVTDIRFASLERAILGQAEVAIGIVPGGGPATRLPGIVGRGRAFEILLGGADFPGDLAERYGYVNRAIPDQQFDEFVNRFASRIASFDRRGLTDIKHFVNAASLPDDSAFPPQLAAFRAGAAAASTQERFRRLFELGLQTRSDLELRLGEVIGT